MAESEYEFSPNQAIEAELQKMLGEFDNTSKQRLSKVIKQKTRAALKHRDENTDAEARNVFREIIPAYMLNRSGFNFQYEREFGRLTPDWFDEQNNLVLECYTFQRGGNSEFAARAWSMLNEKCGRYESLVSENGVRFVISVYLDFLASPDLSTVAENHAKIKMWLNEFEHLWGILFYAESSTPLVTPIDEMSQGELMDLLTRDSTIEGNSTFNFYCRDDTSATLNRWPFPNQMVN